jgi:cobalamin biosynthesis protein CbiD
MSQSEEASLEAAYDKAAEIAERHLAAALAETGVPDYLIAVMMIEAAVNAAVDLTSAEDILKLLQDLTEQIAADAAEGE